MFSHLPREYIYIYIYIIKLKKENSRFKKIVINQPPVVRVASGDGWRPKIEDSSG